MEAVPIIAWEQAVYVCLFIAFFGGVLAWLTKQSEKWQEFIFKVDNQWRQFNKEQREENNCAMSDVNESLANLASITGKLVMTVDEMRADINTHDKQAKEILALVSKPVPKPRVKPQ